MAENGLHIKCSNVLDLTGLNCLHTEKLKGHNSIADLVGQDADTYLSSIQNLLDVHKQLDTLIIEVKRINFNSLFTIIKDKCLPLIHFEIWFTFGKITDEELKLIADIGRQKLVHLNLNESNLKCVMGGNQARPFGDEGMSYLFENCPKIEILKLNTANCISKDFWKMLPTSLKSLLLPVTWLSEEVASSLVNSSVSTIEHLNLMAIESEAFKIICSNLLDLKSLVVGSIKFESPDSLLPLRNLTLLEEIYLSSSEFCFDDPVIEVFKACKNIKKATFCLFQLTDKSLVKIGENCSDLEEINIHNYSHEDITDASLNSLANLQYLTTLSLPGSKITDEGIIKLFSSAKAISKLSVYGCPNVTNRTYDFIVDFAEKNLNRQFTLEINSDSITKVNLPKNLHILTNDSIY